MDFPALALTLRLACATTALLLLLATPLAAWIAEGLNTSITGDQPTRDDPLEGHSSANRSSLSASSVRHHVPRRLVQALVALPLVLPPTVLGFYLLWGAGPATPSGRLLIAVLGHPLAFTFSGLLAGSMIFSLPFAVQPLVAGFAAVDPRLRETAAVLGASPFTVFRRITLPLTGASFLTAAVLTFAHTVGEFGVVLMIGGDIPGVTRTLSIALYDRVQEGNYASANHIAVALVAASFLALLAVYAFAGRPRRGLLA